MGLATEINFLDLDPDDIMDPMTGQLLPHWHDNLCKYVEQMMPVVLPNASSPILLETIKSLTLFFTTEADDDLSKLRPLGVKSSILSKKIHAFLKTRHNEFEHFVLVMDCRSLQAKAACLPTVAALTTAATTTTPQPADTFTIPRRRRVEITPAPGHVAIPRPAATAAVPRLLETTATLPQATATTTVAPPPEEAPIKNDYTVYKIGTKRFLKDHQREAIGQRLKDAAAKNHGELPPGVKSDLARLYQLDLHGVSNIWKNLQAHGSTKSSSNKKEKQWNAAYQKMLAYKATKGNCLVPFKYKEDKQLGAWVAKQRTVYKNGKMTEDRKQLLNDINFVWKLVTR